MTLENALADFRPQQCSDPKDKIFAFLGVAFPCQGIWVDYNASKSVVYTASVKALFRLNENPLLFVETPRRSLLSSELPSWVPDWTEGQGKMASFMALE